MTGWGILLIHPFFPPNYPIPPPSASTTFFPLVRMQSHRFGRTVMPREYTGGTTCGHYARVVSAENKNLRRLRQGRS
jgi:hypothetical protein